MKLQTKIITTVIIISISINSLFQYNDVRLKRKTALENLNIKIQKTSDLLSNVNSGPLFYYDVTLIETNIYSFLKDSEIRSIHVLEESGEIDIHRENETISGLDLIEVETDVYYEEDKVGRIITTYTKDIINKKIADSVKYSIITLIATSLLISIFLLVILRKITKPIAELTELTYEISNGHLDKEIKIFSSDEIGNLAKSFIRMRDSIKQQILFLKIENDERKKAEIELLVKTEELAEANNELTEHRVNLEELINKRTFQLQESLTNLEKTQYQLVESEKMASLGNLVAGVAHEINTPIGIGVTAASHLEHETKEFLKAYEKNEISRSLLERFSVMVGESSKMILSNMLRAASLIQSFKKVAVDQSSEEIRSFMIKEYIDEVFMSIHSKFKNTSIEIVIECEEDFSITSYPGALSQVITNLSINSLQHGFENIKEGKIEVKIFKDDETAKIEYSDTGCGISEDNIKQLFEPFFTTKRGQGGSGLGMNIVYNLINQTLRGSVECSSKLGVGTKFKINFPIKIDNLKRRYNV
ncbi:MAG: ATP-binding protein [Spirochaetaceae bacterium]